MCDVHIGQVTIQFTCSHPSLFIDKRHGFSIKALFRPWSITCPCTPPVVGVTPESGAIMEWSPQLFCNFATKMTNESQPQSDQYLLSTLILNIRNTGLNIIHGAVCFCFVLFYVQMFRPWTFRSQRLCEHFSNVYSWTRESTESRDLEVFHFHNPALSKSPHSATVWILKPSKTPFLVLR